MLSGSSFLLHHTHRFPLPYDLYSTDRSPCHSLHAICHISTLPGYVFSHSTSLVLKELSTNTRKAIPITFLLLNSSQGTQKSKCFNMKLPQAGRFCLWFSLFLSFACLHGCPGFCAELSTGQFCPVTIDPMGCRDAEKKIINKHKIYMKDKAREQATLSHLPHTTTGLDIKATWKNPILCCHANTRNSRKNSNQ